MAKKSFSTWFLENLSIGRFPVPGEVTRLSFSSHVINVSDEYIHHNATAALRRGVYHHWFPLNECVGHMGLNSLFAALCVLHQAEADDAHVLLHCHAGINRSPLVRSAYHYMRTGRHLHEAWVMPGVRVNFLVAENVTVPDNDKMMPNMLLFNCQSNLLPPLVLVEKFLKHLGTRLEETVELAASRGGLLTQLKLDIGLQ